MDEFGSVSFAPTADQAQDALRRGQLEGIPQAIKVLSLRLPRVLGVKAPTAPDLLNARGAQGMDPFLSAVIQTLAKTIAPMGFPDLGDQAGMGMPFAPPMDAQPGPAGPPGKPRIEILPNPPGMGGTAGPDPFQRRRPVKDIDDGYRRMI